MYLLFLSQLFKVYEGTSGNTASFTSSWKMHVIKNDSCISKNFAPQQSSFILIFYKYFKHPHMPCVTHQIQFFLPCQYYGKGGIKSRNISESPSLLKFHQVDFGLWTSLSLEINSDFLQIQKIRNLRDWDFVLGLLRNCVQSLRVAFLIR